MTKPIYSIPSMAEIDAVADTGLRIVSTFSGCGGSCLGFRMAGYRTLWASEFIQVAARTYQLNHPDVPVDTRDIRDVSGDDILRGGGLSVGDVDVFEGSPPCASFSTAGKGAAGWGEVKKYSETTQRVDDLFDEYVRLVGEIRPRVFVAENVPGLIAGKAKGYYLRVRAALREHGYQVAAAVLDAQWLGVPQVRKRVIIMGVRDDVGQQPRFPKPLPYRYSIADACPWVRPGGVSPFAVEDDASIDRYAIGAEWRKLSPGKQSERFFSLVLPDPRSPSPTITQTGGASVGAASVVHPYECRKFAIAEVKRLCGFPDDFRLPGTYAQGYERLGRAVPPPMMHAVATTIRDSIL